MPVHSCLAPVSKTPIPPSRYTADTSFIETWASNSVISTSGRLKVRVLLQVNLQATTGKLTVSMCPQLVLGRLQTNSLFSENSASRVGQLMINFRSALHPALPRKTEST